MNVPDRIYHLMCPGRVLSDMFALAECIYQIFSNWMPKFVLLKFFREFISLNYSHSYSHLLSLTSYQIRS